MTKREKTTQAIHKTARLNPINPLEKQVMAVIEHWEKKGVNFKQLVCDRIARYDMELTPEIYARDIGLHSLSIEDLLRQYSDYLLDELRTQGFTTPKQTRATDDGEDDNGTFSRNLMSGFLARKRQATGDDE